MDKLIKIIAGRLGIDEEIVEKAVRSQFKFTAETIQEGEFQSVHLHHFGKIAVKPNAIARLEKMKYGKQVQVQESD